MAEFFEFFFSGPGWGWKLVGLIWLISVFGEVVVKIINAILDYKVKKFKAEIIAAAQSLDSEDKNSSATADDVRS